MSRFAPVAPPHILRQLKEKGLLGTYHLLLAHDVAANPQEYGEIFDVWNHAIAPRSYYIVMDNSVIELGHPVDADTMEKAYHAVRPSEVVLPDVIGKMLDTVSMSRKFASLWHPRGLSPFQAVLQGATLDELKYCADCHARIQGVFSFGVPRWTVELLGTRRGLVEYLQQEHPHFYIHLLGFSDNIEDDLECAQMSGVVGIDSAVPIRMGLQGAEFRAGMLLQVPRGDYWNTKDDLNEVAIDNLRWIREQLGDEL